MAKKRELLAGFFIVCALLACKRGATKSFDKMQKASCDGDVPGFFQYVNKTKLTDAIKTRATEAARATAKTNLEKSLVDSVAPAAGARAAEQAFQEWEDDIKRGSESSFCKASVDESTETRVSWTTPSGKKKVGHFEESGDRWLLVNLE